MKTIFTQDFIRDNLDCYVKSNKRFYPIAENALKRFSGDLELRDILTSEIRLQDKFWWLISKCELSDIELEQLSIKAADIALFIYEKENPGDTKLRDILGQTKGGINPLVEVRDMIFNLNEHNSSASAVKSIARASKTIFTGANKMNSTARAIFHGLVASSGNKEYQALFETLLKDYYE